MAGPLGKQTLTKLIGHGFRLGQKSPSVKWGVDATDLLPSQMVSDYTYANEDFLNMLQGN